MRVLPVLCACALTALVHAAVPDPVLPVRALSTLPTHGDAVPGLAYDGSTDTYFLADRNAKVDDTFTFTFAAVTKATHVELLTGEADGTHQLAAGVLEISADGTAWREAAKFAAGVAKADLGGQELKAVRLRATADGADTLAVRELVLASTPAVPPIQYPFEVRLDYSEVPAAQDFMERSQALCEAWWPTLCELLKSDGYKPRRSVKITYKLKMDGVAYTSAAGIFCADGYFKSRKSDIGAIFHELVHWQQQYRGGTGWLTEGIADYLRYYVYEPERGQRFRFSADRVDYHHAYQEAAGFLNWLVVNKDKELIAQLNAASRTRKYKDSLFADLCGKPLDELFAEYKEALRHPPTPPKPAA